ncbi:MAG: tRNA pseudouridine(38-40) synthase TruA [Akkermansia sp.]
MARIRFTVTYDGRHFSGWQVQLGVPTVQESLEKAFFKTLGIHLRVHGSGRTDAGVHALGQVCHIEAPATCRIPTEQWPAAINSRLPRSIRVLHAEYVADDFHARYSASGKTYRYIISTRPICDPFDSGLTWHVPRPLNLMTMKAGMEAFMGTHDFKAFAALRGNEPNPIPEDHFVRTISEASLTQESGRIILTFTGTGFLYKMVRLMTGGIHALGTKRIELPYFLKLLHTPTHVKSPLCAPADGLYLVRVYYPQE